MLGRSRPALLLSFRGQATHAYAVSLAPPLGLVQSGPMLGTAANTMAASGALTSFGVRGIGRCTLQAADSQQSAVHPPHGLPERACKSAVTSHSARRPLHSQHVQPLQASTLRSGASRCNRSVQLQPTRLLQHKQPNRAPPRACAAERVAPECSEHPECNAPSQAMHTRPNPSTRTSQIVKR